MTNTNHDHHSLEELKEKGSEYGIKSDSFPKNVGIVFIEGLKYDNKKTFKNTLKQFFLKITSIRTNRPRLNFNQLACAHFLLQMNTVQNIFDFQVIRLEFDKHLSSPTEDYNYNYNLKWFDDEISKFENTEEGKAYDIDYWIGITSKEIEYNWFYVGKPKEQRKSGKAIITSLDWVEVNSPPSLFEYIAMSALMCSLYFVNREFY